MSRPSPAAKKKRLHHADVSQKINNKKLIYGITTFVVLVPLSETALIIYAPL